MRKLSVWSSIVAMIALFGCGSSSTDESIVVTLGAPIAVSDLAVKVNVKISSPEEITNLVVDVRDSSDVSVSSDNIVLPAENKYLGKTSADFDVVINLNNGTYSMLVTAQSETLEGSATTDIVKGSTQTEGTQVTERTVQLGAKNVANYGSLLDVDAMEPYLLGEARNNDSVQKKIDILFWFSTVDDLDHLAFVSPSDAIGVIDDWDAANKNSTEFKYVNNVDFSTITTQESIDALWSDTNDVGKVAPVEVGDLIAVKTQQGNIRLVRIESIDNDMHDAIITVIGKI